MSQSSPIENAILDLSDKRYFSIGEVAKLCALNASVLRYWETEFPTLKPITRKGNRRYYKKSDILLIEKIKNLLYQQGFTIDGARNLLQQKNTPQRNAKCSQKTALQTTEVNQIINELQELELLLTGLR